MYAYRLLIPCFLCAPLGACGADPLVCTAVIVGLPVTVINGTAQPLSPLSVTDTVVRTGVVLDLSAGRPPASLPPHGSGPLIIFDDSFISAVAPIGDDVGVAITAGGHAATARFRFGSDGCHVRKLAGPDTLTVS